MRKQTVVAGLIAGAVIACSGPGMEAAGGMMNDAGHAMAGMGGKLAAAGMHASGTGGVSAPGGKGAGSGGLLGAAGNMMAAAGNAMAAAGASIAGAGRGGTAGQAQETSGDGLPRPHWVLRDKSGTPVQADFFPVHPRDEAAYTNAQPECVGITYFGNRHIGGLYYSLSQGKLGGCPILSSYASWHESPLAYYLDSACSGPAYYTSAAWSFTFIVGGTHYYTDGTPSTAKATLYYHWNQTTQKCDTINNASGQDLWAFKAVPSDVVNLLPNPPYSLELVY